MAWCRSSGELKIALRKELSASQQRLLNGSLLHVLCAMRKGADRWPRSGKVAFRSRLQVSNEALSQTILIYSREAQSQRSEQRAGTTVFSFPAV
jgi:hypothetical protein